VTSSRAAAEQPPGRSPRPDAAEAWPAYHRIAPSAVWAGAWCNWAALLSILLCSSCPGVDVGPLLVSLGLVEAALRFPWLRCVVAGAAEVVWPARVSSRLSAGKLLDGRNVLS